MRLTTGLCFVLSAMGLGAVPQVDEVRFAGRVHVVLTGPFGSKLASERVRIFVSFRQGCVTAYNPPC